MPAICRAVCVRVEHGSSNWWHVTDTVTSRYPSGYDLSSCQNVKLQRPSITAVISWWVSIVPVRTYDDFIVLPPPGRHYVGTMTQTSTQISYPDVKLGQLVMA